MKVFCLCLSALFVFSGGNPIGGKLDVGKHECDFWEPESGLIKVDILVDCLFGNQNQTDMKNRTSEFKNVLKNLIDSMVNAKDVVCNVIYVEKMKKTIDDSEIPDTGKYIIKMILEFVRKTCTSYESTYKKKTKQIITQRMISTMTSQGEPDRNKREVATPLISLQLRFLISTVFNIVKETINDQHKLFPSLLQNNGKKMSEIISTLNMSQFVKEDILNYVWGIKKSNMEAENLLLNCSKNITNELIPSIITLSINNIFGESAFVPLGYNDSVETNLLGWMMGRSDLSESTIKVILKIHDFLHNFTEKFNLDLFLDELENIYFNSLNDNKSVCSAYTTVKKNLNSILDPILQNSTEKSIGNTLVSEAEKRERVEMRMKRNTEKKGYVSWKPMTNREWNAKKEEFFKKYLEVEVNDTNSSYDVKESVDGILVGFSIESGEGDRPTTLKMSKKWKPVAERIKRASGENQTSALTGLMDEEDEERLSLSQDEKILLEEALDHIISSIINHRNEMMSKTRKFISLVVHILAKSDQMEPESLSCIARAGVTFMAETRKHLNTVFKGFRTELETMKKNLWSEDSVDGSDKDETITKLISTELMRDVADAIAASTRTYEVNKVRLFEKFMLCKEKNSS